MRKILITNKAGHIYDEDGNRSTKIEKCAPGSELGIDCFVQLNTCDTIALDIETTGLNPWRDKILLVALYNPSLDFVVVIDIELVELGILNILDWKNKVMIAHNAAFELKFLLTKGVDIPNVYCTMVAEQKILQGAGFSMSLVNTLARRNIQQPEEMDKAIRTDFVQEEFILEEKHILYNISDVLLLHQLMEKQKKLIQKFKLNFFIYSIHMPLIVILVKMELEGFIHNSEKWIKHADETENYCLELNNQLNDLILDKINWREINSDFKKLNDQKINGINRSEKRIAQLKEQLINMKKAGKVHLKTFKKAQDSYIKASEDLEKFSDMSITNYIGINWASSKQVLEAFRQLSLTPLPEAKSATTHKLQASTSVAARHAWLLENKNNKYYDMMVLFDDMQGKLHNVKSFGRKWVEKYTNPFTGKVHTSYRQDAATGRLTSGNAKEGLFNSQQIPALNVFRHCFGVETDYMVGTLDYSGAELCFMGAVAKDDRLIELSKGDMHSFFANKGWKAIYEFRGIPWTSDNIISKNQNKDVRTVYKSMAFGTVYGLRDKKAAETLNVSVKEGQIAIDTIVSEIPKTIAMVEAATAFAKYNGYVIHNTRTNSRRWFTDVLTAQREGRELTYMERKNVEGASRNTRIQGSQSDMIMEAIVVVYRWIKIFNIDAIILGTVHDEIIIKYHKSIHSWFPAKVKILMEMVAANYMDGFLTLKVDAETGLTWTK